MTGNHRGGEANGCYGGAENRLQKQQKTVNKMSYFTLLLFLLIHFLSIVAISSLLVPYKPDEKIKSKPS